MSLSLMFMNFIIHLQAVLLVLHSIHLVGFHGGTRCFGLLWFLALMIRNAKRGLNLYNAPKFYVC